MDLKQRLKNFQEKISSTQLVVVTKGRSQKELLGLIEAGVKDIAENKLQEIQKKYDTQMFRLLEKNNIRLHFIGHLQSNKVKKIVQMCDVIQTVDSIKIAKKINAAAQELNKVVPIYLQVNLTGENQKYGITVAENDTSLLEQIIYELDQKEHLHLEGLMCMGKAGKDNETRAVFKKCRRLAQQFGLAEVSMGMSQDYLIALEEGSTMLRIGSAIFDEKISEA